MSAPIQWYQTRTGEYYCWSERERCYVFADGRRFAGPAPTAAPQPPQAPARQEPRDVPRARPQPSAPVNPSGYPSPEQYPQYTTSRDRGLSISSGGSGPSLNNPQYGGRQVQAGASAPAPQPARDVRNVRFGPAGVPPASGFSQDPSIASRMAALNVQDSNYPTNPSTYTPTAMPRRQDWYIQHYGASSATVSGQSSRQPAEQTATRQRTAHKNIRGTEGDYEQLDSRYRKRPHDFFKPGRVFKMRWAEPSGRNPVDEDATVVTPRKELLDEKFVNPDFVPDRRFGGWIYSKIRWFIVVRQGSGKCGCVPIVTYNGQGVAKPGVVKGEHAIAHVGKDAPSPRRNEAPASMHERPLRTPIRIQPDERGDVLEDMSRIDYGRVYTVEHNVKAMAFGCVHTSSEKDFQYNWRNVFMNEDSSDEDESDEDEESDEEEAAPERRAASSKSQQQSSRPNKSKQPTSNVQTASNQRSNTAKQSSRDSQRSASKVSRQSDRSTSSQALQSSKTAASTKTNYPQNALRRPQAAGQYSLAQYQQVAESQQQPMSSRMAAVTAQQIAYARRARPRAAEQEDSESEEEEDEEDEESSDEDPQPRPRQR